MLFYRKKKRFPFFSAQRKLAILIMLFILSVAGVFYFVNNQLTPTYLDYAEVQTNKIASMVISKAINSRTANVLDVNDIIEEVPSTNGSTNMVTTKFNTEIINRVLSDTNSLVQAHLEQAEKGNLSSLPYLDDIEYDKTTMEDQGGVVFFVPMGQATNIPLIGNLGPKIPIRFHVIGNVQSTVVPTIENFGINNAYVEVSIHIKVNVQVIVPLASKMSVVEQKIPVAMGLVQGQVPHIYTGGDGSAAPSVEVPIPLPEK
ncbi:MULTISPECIES: sporulation protein YunB [unclassified Psychrobacillus]|uniref:sporulation protein YunB n=1 Tax=unclassified Psychrobacillus TaxID=2636677 RepID=UPI0024960DBE|nr:sporulation protein YunB [Psychrobacillus sp. NEAU-3TGS]MDI2586495.1 sporulation protein YunB [Psychrobacillus sp. NEAU-3TGS]